MTIEQAKIEIPDLETYFKLDCDVNCLHDFYCPSDCKEHIKARKLGIDKIQSAYARHDGDLVEVTKYIRRASV
jgi:hypothetical protein